MTPLRVELLNALAEEGLAADQALLLADTFEAELTRMVAAGTLKLSGRLSDTPKTKAGRETARVRAQASDRVTSRATNRATSRASDETPDVDEGKPGAKGQAAA